MEMGVLSRASRGVAVNVEVEATLTDDVMAKFGDGAVGKVLQDPESRRKVMGVVERFLKLPAPSGDTN